MIHKNYITAQNQFTYNISETGNQFLNKIVPHWENAMKETADRLGGIGVSSLNILTEQLTTTKQ